MNHWKELADVFLVQYDHNIHSAPDLFDLQRMEKKSGESFHEYVQGWRERASTSSPWRERDDEDLHKYIEEPYFDNMLGLQLQIFADLIPIGERVKDTMKSKKIVDTSALLALAKQAMKKTPAKKKER